MKTLAHVCLPLLAAILSILPSAKAHGYIANFIVDGVSYLGNAPNVPTQPSPIRQISKVNPVKNATNPFLSCGQNAQPASMVVDVNPGSNITFEWGVLTGPGTHWPHGTGPLITYMASCGSVTCDKFDASTAQWFKIKQTGLKRPGVWYQTDLKSGAPYSTNIPNNIAPGQYLVRQEIIALHLAKTIYGAEFYPSCTQVNVKGSGTGVPPASDLVSFPGAYKDTDPGIFDPHAYDPKAVYTFPGPPVVSFTNSQKRSADYEEASLPRYRSRVMRSL